MNLKIFGLGELLWDLLPSGRQLGGAPANFVFHVQCLGADTSLITRIGDDDLGKEALQAFNQKHLSSTLIQIDKQNPTGTVDVTFPSHGIPEYTIHENVAWDYLTVTQQALTAISHADAVCFGSLSQRNPVASAAIFNFLAAAPQNALIVFDINLRQTFFTKESLERSFQRANILKLNNDELDILTDLFQISGTIEQKIIWLAQTHSLETIALTLGSNGSMLYHQGTWSIERPTEIDAVDTVGAGDAFTAALIVGLLHGLKAERVHKLAAEIAGYVCSQHGAMPLLPEIFRDRISKFN